MSINCGVLLRLDVLRSLQEYVMYSPCRTDEVEASCKVLRKQIITELKSIASDKIICAMTIKEFGADTEAYQAAMGVYKVDRNLFGDIMYDVFNEIACEDSFHGIIEILETFEDSNAIAYAYCSLYKHIGQLLEHLWAFECSVRRLLRQSDLEPNEISKLNVLLVGIAKNTIQYVQHGAILSALNDMGDW